MSQFISCILYFDFIKTQLQNKTGLFFFILEKKVLSGLIDGDSFEIKDVIATS